MQTLIVFSILVIQKKYASGHQKECDNQVQRIHTAMLGKEQKRQNRAENRGGEGEDRYLRHGVVLQEHAPQCICHGREECEVDKYDNALCTLKTYTAAKKQTEKDHKCAAEYELIAAEENCSLRRFGVFDKMKICLN